MPVQAPEIPFKILFIKPCADIRPQFIEIPLTFLCLSAYLKKYLDKKIKVDLIDLRLDRKPTRSLKKKLTEFVPDLIGVSLLAQDRNFLPQWRRFFKRHAPGARIIIGGPYATYEYEEALLNNPEVDCAVLGEGEETFRSLVEALIQGDEIKSLPGIAYVANGKVISNGKANYIIDLDTIPRPDYGLVRLGRYQRFTQLSMNNIVTTRKHIPIISSRGCPYGCIYCHDMFGKKVRKRSPENFVSEIKWLYDQQGIREFHIVDDIFNIDRQRMLTILHLIIDSGRKIKIAFPNGLRADLLNEDDLKLLKKAGTYMMTVAIESASQKIQEMINKHLDIDNALRNIEFASKIGIMTRGTFMLGFPGESESEIEKTIDLAIRSKLDLATFFSVVPFKNTELDLLVKKMFPDLERMKQWYFWDRNPFYQRATGYHLKREQNLAYLKFYLPFRIIRTFLRAPGKTSMLMWPLWGAQILFPQLSKKLSNIKMFNKGAKDTAEKT